MHIENTEVAAKMLEFCVILHALLLSAESVLILFQEYHQIHLSSLIWSKLFAKVISKRQMSSPA